MSPGTRAGRGLGGRLTLALALSAGALHAEGITGQAVSRAPRVAAAANLNVVLTGIADRFRRETGVRVELVFGASGTLTRQIQEGAPFELFLAADEDFPRRLSAAGLTR